MNDGYTKLSIDMYITVFETSAIFRKDTVYACFSCKQSALRRPPAPEGIESSMFLFLYSLYLALVYFPCRCSWRRLSS